MKKLLLPIILLIVGTGAGAGAGFVLKPAPEEVAEELDPNLHCGPEDSHDVAETEEKEDEVEPVDPDAERAYAKLNNQFVVPIVTEGKISALMALSLTIEVLEGDQQTIFSAEPKLRDVFLQVMFDHANTGGFSGNFTTGTNMANLRSDLLRSARKVVGEKAIDVLILDIVRQDA